MDPKADDPGKPRSRQDENLKPGSPPRTSTEPQGSEGSVKNSKTLSDPSTGEPNPGRHDTAAGG